MSGFFITGTDTEIGKTYVSTQIIKLLIDEGLRVAVMKPIASGAHEISGELKNDDALSLIEACNTENTYRIVNPYVFEPAISPHLAAEKKGVEINLNEIKNNFEQLKNKSDVVVVEGVGGWYAPISCHTTVADLAETLGLPIILVVGLRLGCLNHAILTAQGMRQSGLKIAGWVANHIEKDFSFAEENISTLKHFLHDIPFIGSLPHQNNSKNNAPHNYLNKQLLIDRLSFKK